MALNAKQLKFIEEYINNGFNGRKAYLKAYQTCKTERAADASAAKLLSNPSVKAKLEEEKEELRKKSDIKREEILRDLKIIKDSKYSDFCKIVKKTRIIDKINFETGEMEQEEEVYFESEPVPTEELTEEQKKCIKTIELTKWGPRYILYEKTDAIDKINKMLGYYNEIINLDTRIDTSSVSELTTEELMKLIENLDDEEDD